jgi:hypothetical protein
VLGGIHRLPGGVGNDDRYGLADVTDAITGQRRLAHALCLRGTRAGGRVEVRKIKRIGAVHGHHTGHSEGRIQ